MNSLKRLIPILLVCCCLSCGKDGTAADPLADSGRTERTELLLENLRDIVTEKGFLVGQQDATLYGIGWSNEPERSDIQSVCGEMPALVGFDITGYATNDSLSSDNIEFAKILAAAIWQYDHSGMVAMTGNAADIKFLNRLVTPYGVKVPVVFTPKDVVDALVREIEDNDVTNALIASTEDGEKVDVLTASFAFSPEKEDSVSLMEEAQALDAQLAKLQSLAKQKNKPFALSTLSYKGLKYAEFWTHILLPVLEKYNLSYILLGSNADGSTNDFCVPYLGHVGCADFVRFYNSKKSLFLKETPAIYTNIKAHREKQAR